MPDAVKPVDIKARLLELAGLTEEDLDAVPRCDNCGTPQGLHAALYGNTFLHIDANGTITELCPVTVRTSPKGRPGHA